MPHNSRPQPNPPNNFTNMHDCSWGEYLDGAYEMTFRHKTFDVQVVRRVDPDLTSWPKPSEVAEGRNPGGNKEYGDLRGLSWDEAREVRELENEYIVRVERASLGFGNEPLDAEELFDEIFDDEELAELMGLDMGVAATVAALSAAGFIPCTSCNGGAFGGRHHEAYPLVAFYARPEALTLLLQCAQESEVGMDNDQGWSPDDLPIVVYADDIRKMDAFAEALSKRSSDFHALADGGHST